MMDKIFTSLDLYSNPQLGIDLTVIPTTGDMWIIFINTLLSSIGAFYLMFKMDID